MPSGPLLISSPLLEQLGAGTAQAVVLGDAFEESFGVIKRAGRYLRAGHAGEAVEIVFERGSKSIALRSHDDEKLSMLVHGAKMCVGTRVNLSKATFGGKPGPPHRFHWNDDGTISRAFWDDLVLGVDIKGKALDLILVKRNDSRRRLCFTKTTAIEEKFAAIDKAEEEAQAASGGRPTLWTLRSHCTHKSRRL